VRTSGPGAYLSVGALASLAPRLLDLLSEDQYRSDRMLDQYREEWLDAANFGLEQRELVLRRANANTSEHSLAIEGSSAGALEVMNAKQAASKLGTGVRAVQRRAARGSLPAVRKGRAWFFDAAEIDRFAREA
jgi:excisionase family DNA binding protein